MEETKGALKHRPITVEALMENSTCQSNEKQEHMKLENQHAPHRQHAKNIENIKIKNKNNLFLRNDLNFSQSIWGTSVGWHLKVASLFAYIFSLLFSFFFCTCQFVKWSSPQPVLKPYQCLFLWSCQNLRSQRAVTRVLNVNQTPSTCERGKKGTSPVPLPPHPTHSSNENRNVTQCKCASATLIFIVVLN